MVCRYEKKDAVSNHIWDSLVQGSVEDVIDQARAEHAPIPQVHVDWLISTEQQNRQKIKLGGRE